MMFHVLDQPKSEKKSNKTENPNAQKVNQCFTNPFGHVFVVNAEKVILNRTYLNKNQTLFEKTEDEKDRYANELRNLIGKIPRLSILIDEVHHATVGDIKLRQVVTKWNITGNITTVIGFSGTPFLSKKDTVGINNNLNVRISQITNTVYHYPLTYAIKKFLKNPKVKSVENLSGLPVIKKGIEDFQELYGGKYYENGTIAKIAIYCSNIKNLEEEVYPFLTNSLEINPNEILKYHKGNKDYKVPEENELFFKSLDIPEVDASRNKRYILLVQVGKEGWNCKSLTGIILSQKGSCPKNMVLQTCCRCLRQVDKGHDETAVIWLNEHNEKTLNNQLKKEQQTDIEEINNIGRRYDSGLVHRTPRIDRLQLPPIEFYQFKVTYQTVEKEKKVDTEHELTKIINSIDTLKNRALVRVSELNDLDSYQIDLINQIGDEYASFDDWLLTIAKEGFNSISFTDLSGYMDQLETIFSLITYEKNGIYFFNDLYDIYSLNTLIRLSFHQKHIVKTKNEVIKKKAQLLIVDKLNHVEDNDKIYPDEKTTKEILEYDRQKSDISIIEQNLMNEYNRAIHLLREQGLNERNLHPPSFSKEIRLKDRTFHYIPYNFIRSNFEKDILNNILSLSSFKSNNIEIYYNGERGLTEFVIDCYSKNGEHWKNIGRYTPDFLIVKRDENNEIRNALIIETKGRGYEEDSIFQRKRAFIESDFLQKNKEKFGYKKFDYLYVPESNTLEENIENIIDKINEFFEGEKKCQ